MKRLVIAAAVLLASACTPPAAEEAPTSNTDAPELEGVMLPLADLAGNRMEALSQVSERWCTGDGVWCAVNDGVGIVVMRGGVQAGSIAVGEPDNNTSWDAWPVIVRLGRADDSALLGVVLTTNQMYSGGGGQASQLILYSVANGVVNEVTRLPLSASSMVRACFDEEDQTQRAGACHDEYSFVTRISLDETVAEGAPKIWLQTAAGSYPGRVTRDADSLQEAPLTEADLVWAHDEACSYRRTYTRGADGLYAPDQPLPACTDYLEP